MGNEEIRLSFEDWAEPFDIDLSVDFFNLQEDPNPYIESEAYLAYDAWCSAIEYQKGK